MSDTKNIVEQFIKTVYPEMTELCMSVNTEENCLRDATELINSLKAGLAAADKQMRELVATVNVLLDCIDYTVPNCGFAEPVAGVLPKEIIALARDVLRKHGKDGAA